VSWWKRKKCGSCRKVLKAKRGIHEIRLESADGIVEVEICGECADFWDKSAEVLQGKPRNVAERTKSGHSGEDEEVY
jgi:RNase P subunit RPR2